MKWIGSSDGFRALLLLSFCTSAASAQGVFAGAESPRLSLLAEARPALGAAPSPEKPWPAELPVPLRAVGDANPKGELAFLEKAVLPDFPVRAEPRVLKFIEFFRDDPKGKMLFASYLKRSARLRPLLMEELKRKGMPQDLVWLVMVESGFEIKARSSAGAFGLWQFMPDTARLYGLRVDRWLDERLDVAASTRAAADYLLDVYRRFGNWDLALAAYNYGYPGVANAMRKFNTNDFWVLEKQEGGLPWETSLYVPKMHALAIMAKNPKLFGFDPVEDQPLTFDTVRVRPGVAFADLAKLAGVQKKDLDLLNPEFRASRTPPFDKDSKENPPLYVVRVPPGKGGALELALQKMKLPTPELTYVVKQGDTLESIASEQKVSVSDLSQINELRREEILRSGTTLLLPSKSESSGGVTASGAGATVREVLPTDKPVATVPDEAFIYPDRKRVFYRVVVGDTFVDISQALGVTLDELTRWNRMDLSARLQEGMMLQVFVPQGASLNAKVLDENEVRLLVVGSDDFYAYYEGLKGRRRVIVAAKKGDTLETLAQEYGLEAASLERINHKNRKTAHFDGEPVVIYVPQATALRHEITTLTKTLPALGTSQLVAAGAGPASSGGAANLPPVGATASSGVKSSAGGVTARPKEPARTTESVNSMPSRPQVAPNPLYDEPDELQLLIRKTEARTEKSGNR